MPQFADERDAKEFLIGLILSEADREGTPLSELERRMLYFSENGWTLPGMADTAHIFERECNSEQYETKITALAKKLEQRLKSDDPKAFKAWSNALEKLSKGDHYLLVLTQTDEARGRPHYDLLKLCLTALLIVIIVGLGLMAFLPEHGTGLPAREKSAFILWLIALIAASALPITTLIAGREKANDLLSMLISKMFGGPPPKR